MKPIVFLGPTLAAHDARVLLDADYRPPAAQGDVLRAALCRPSAIGIIDGYFERIPSVWHKEILFALNNGIPVLGSASMGALRAAELHPFGMVGVGQVFAAFASGELIDDDEVAVAHGDADSGYRVASDAMVNIRATLRRAANAGVLDEHDAATLTELAKHRFYPDRSLRMLLRDASGTVSVGVLERLRTWLSDGYVDVKRADALAMLAHMNSALEPEKDLAATFDFASTESWRTLFRSVKNTSSGNGDGVEVDIDPDAILDEARFADPVGFVRLEKAALLRLLVGEAARSERPPATPDELRWAIIEVRRAHGLIEPGDVDKWIADNEIAKQDFARLGNQDLELAWALDKTRDQRQQILLDELRRTGAYVNLARRARSKRAALAQRDLRPASEDDVADVDPSLAAAFASSSTLRSALAREQAYAEDFAAQSD